MERVATHCRVAAQPAHEAHRMGYWYTSSLNFDVTVRKLKSARLCPLESRHIFSSAGTIGVISVPASDEIWTRTMVSMRMCVERGELGLSIVVLAAAVDWL
jgi:hypothetical protein